MSSNHIRARSRLHTYALVNAFAYFFILVNFGLCCKNSVEWDGEHSNYKAFKLDNFPSIRKVTKNLRKIKGCFNTYFEMVKTAVCTGQRQPVRPRWIVGAKHGGASNVYSWVKSFVGISNTLLFPLGYPWCTLPVKFKGISMGLLFSRKKPREDKITEQDKAVLVGTNWDFRSVLISDRSNFWLFVDMFRSSNTRETKYNNGRKRWALSMFANSILWHLKYLPICEIVKINYLGSSSTWCSQLRKINIRELMYKSVLVIYFCLLIDIDLWINRYHSFLGWLHHRPPKQTPWQLLWNIFYILIV